MSTDTTHKDHFLKAVCDFFWKLELLISPTSPSRRISHTLICDVFVENFLSRITRSMLGTKS
jgi:hypothetical protein